MSRPRIVALFGNAAHVPEHTLESLASAYTAGADLAWIRVQAARDGALVLFGHDDLAAASDGAGPVGAQTLAQLRALSAGVRFRPGQDAPWSGQTDRKGGRIPKARIVTLDEVFSRLGRLLGWFVEVLAPDDAAFEATARRVLELGDRFGVAQLVLATAQRPRAAALVAALPGRDVALAVLGHSASADDLGFCQAQGIGHLLIEADDQARALLARPSELPRIIVRSDAPAAAELAAPGCWGVAGPSTLRLADAIRGRCEVFSDDFAGDRIDRDRWIAGISSGHEIMETIVARRFTAQLLGPGLQRLVDDIYDARSDRSEAHVQQRDALEVLIAAGNRYASAGVVSIVTVPDPFQISVDFTFENPAPANMMVLAVVNGTVFDRFHREGPVTRPRAYMENPVFDTHGCAPYVSMEREEADGFRIMHNDGNAGVYEWYGNIYCPDIGFPDSRRGRFMLERRGHLFTGYYQDEHNSDWVGVGSVECASLNERVYVRLAAKHYPKAEARDPLSANRATYRRFHATTFRKD